MTHWNGMDVPDTQAWDRVAADLASLPSPVELAERVYLEASRETRRVLETQGSLSAAMAAAREATAGHALLIAKAEVGQCFIVGCRESVEWEYCAEHLTEVAS